MCTFTGCQWNLAVSPAQDFTPPDSGPNATQWALTAKNMGATQICLTVRHVGGFSLWPTASTNYSVAASAWRNGTGDVVREFVEAVRAVGISPCLYIILGFNVHDAHANVSGPLYLERQVIALTELLTNYGQIDRLWWDNVSLHPSCKQGNLPHPILSHSLSLTHSLSFFLCWAQYAIGCCQPVTHQGLYCPGGGTTSTPGPGCPGWQVLIDTVRALSPNTAIVPGPDGCLVNGESQGGTYPLFHATDVEQSSYSCTAASTPNAGAYFAVVESDFTILNPGDNCASLPRQCHGSPPPLLFPHAPLLSPPAPQLCPIVFSPSTSSSSSSSSPSSSFFAPPLAATSTGFWAAKDPYLGAAAIFDQFTLKHEQGANLIFNVPPNATGVVEDAYLAALAPFAAARAATFAFPKGALPAPASAPCAALSVTIPISGDFDTVLLTEDLVAGQVIMGYTLEVARGGAWATLPVGGGGSAGVHGATVGLRILDSVGLQSGVQALRFNCSRGAQPPPQQQRGRWGRGGALPAAVRFQNSAGSCMSIAPNATFPCWSGGNAPGGGFHLCPLLAGDTACSSAASLWTEGAFGEGTLGALAVAPDAVLNVDCNGCARGTHAKLIKTSNCGNCASLLSYNQATSTIGVPSCPGMCLSNGIALGANASCAGTEPWSPAQVHLVPCEQAQGSSGWTRVVPPPIATLAFMGAYLQQKPPPATRGGSV